MILAGDIGGTKTVLALISPEAGVKSPVREERYASANYETFDAVLAEFLEGVAPRPRAASFGIAGPIIDQTCKTTNLPWSIDAAEISSRFGIPSVHLLNDLESIATAVPQLGPDDLFILREGTKHPQGPIGVVAPGTGIGEAFLIWSDGGYTAYATEGGHVSFAPVTPEQLEMLEYLQRRFGHVSVERVCSGSGYINIYDYLLSTGRYEEPEWLRESIAKATDPTPIIMDSGIDRKAPICIAALDLFVGILGGVLGNMALKILATGGLYLGGGLPPRMLTRLQQPDFLDAICYKGRFREWVSRIPVDVILDPKAALHGAAWDALGRTGKYQSTPPSRTGKL
jgi:glucokinase